MPIAWKVYVLEYFKDKGVVFPLGVFVTQALLTLISEAAVPVVPAPTCPLQPQSSPLDSSLHSRQPPHQQRLEALRQWSRRRRRPDMSFIRTSGS